MRTKHHNRDREADGPRVPARAVDARRTDSLGPGEVSRLQRSVGNVAVARVLEGRARLRDDDFDEADELDEEAAEYLYDPTRNPHTLGLYIGPAVAAAEAKAKEAAEARARIAAETKAKEEAAAQARAAAEAKAKQDAEAKAQAEAKAKLDAEAKAKAQADAKEKKEAAAKAKQDAAAKAKQDAEAKAAQDALAKKAVIRQELRTKLLDNVKGTVVDQWAKLSGAQQEQFVQQVFDQKAAQAAYLTAKTAAAALAKAIIRAEKEADLQSDKVWLNRGVDALTATAEIKEMFRAAIALHKKSDDAYGLTIAKAYPEKTIVDACRVWRQLETIQVIDPTAAAPNTRVRVGDKLKIVSNVHSPGSQQSEVTYKQRGKKLERTRNLIVHIEGFASNVHVHPPGGWQKNL